MLYSEEEGEDEEEKKEDEKTKSIVQLFYGSELENGFWLLERYRLVEKHWHELV